MELKNIALEQIVDNTKVESSSTPPDISVHIKNSNLKNIVIVIPFCFSFLFPVPGLQLYGWVFSLIQEASNWALRYPLHNSQYNLKFI